MRLAGESTRSIVETIDVFPALCELAGLPKPDFAEGVSLKPILENPAAAGHEAISYAAARTIRTDTHRLILHKDGYAELYDHTTPEGETKNVAAENPELVAKLRARIESRLNAAKRE